MHHRARVVALLAATTIVPAACAPRPAGSRAEPGYAESAGAAARYRNPIIHADYSDPDVIRVGDDFWMTASSFGSVPALPILHSRDLVHWRIVNHAIPRMPPEFDVPQHGNGVWAPSIRHHDGQFWIYWGDPDRGIYMVKTRDPLGAWEPPVLVHAAKGWIDPTPLWDDDGEAYLVHAFARSRAGIKHRLVVNRMSADGTRLLDEGTLVFMDSAAHPTAEGPKFHKRDGWYWILAPAGGVATGWQLAMRSRSPLGPYEARVVLAQGSTAVNGPHQGAWVELKGAEHWFVHFQDAGAYGRIVHLQPMTWRDGWPVIGDDADGDGTGQPVAEHPMPDVGRAYPPVAPQTSDEFDGPRLGLQWQWAGNPRPDWYTLTAQRGMLTLRPQPLPAATTNLWVVPNLLLQKLPARAFTAMTRVASTTGLAVGEQAGIVMLGRDYAYVALRHTATGYEIVQARVMDAEADAAAEASVVVASVDPPIHLRVTVSDGALCQFAWSADGIRYTPIGAPFTAREGRWIGAKVGLFATRPAHSRTGGAADFDFFHVTTGSDSLAASR